MAYSVANPTAAFLAYMERKRLTMQKAAEISASEYFPILEQLIDLLHERIPKEDKP